ncbi:hypothetical protein GH714_006828 [Hevea brasiliensis]|uniref:Uncharacterized protein n=1 Tax=Hevea brasiliensis TaxID=3981 RepID=A0A6A6KZM5_HEVBR|nr:hypothetical protein GH714_006828 [Hevea brasiliensis]
MSDFFKWIGSLCGEFILADGESLSLSKLDFARILILTDSPTLVSRTVVVNSNYMRFQINAVEEYCHDFFPSPIFKRKSHSPDISSETNSKDNNDNNDGASKDDLLGGDKQNSGDDNLNGMENDTSYYNSDGINCLKNKPGNGDGSYGGSGDKQSSNSGDNLACNVDDMVVPSSINEDPMTRVLADGSAPNVLLCMLKTLSPLNFYTNVAPAIRGIIDAQTGGEFIMKQEDEAYELLEKIAKNTHLWSSPRGPAPTQKRQAAGMYDLDPFNMINEKFDALTNVLAKKMEDLSMLVSSSSSGSS